MQIRTLLPTVAAVTATAVLGGLASRPAKSAWYEKLKKPPYQPPRQAFPIVWPLLYADIAATSAATLDELDRRGQSDAKRAYVTAPGREPRAQRQLVVAVLQSGLARHVGDRCGRIDRQQRRPHAPRGRRARQAGGTAGGLSRVVRVRDSAVDTHLATQPLEGASPIRKGFGCLGRAWAGNCLNSDRPDFPGRPRMLAGALK